ncbi:MAG: hypothetical protein RIS88_2386 [Pseudomonadota bacterium]|jgi:DNA-binding IclR family transcriptional regulator
MRRRSAPLTAGPRPAVDSLQRGLDILRGFEPGEDILPVTEIARRLGLPRATTRRLLETLADDDFLLRAGDGQGYGLHVGCFAIGQAVLGGSALVRAARAPLQALADRHSVHALLAVGDGDALLVLAHLAGVAAPAWPLGVGARLPVADTAPGLAWLWAQPPPVQSQWMAELRASPEPGTLAALWRAFHELETRGTCATLWPDHPSSAMLATPLVLQDGSIAVVACAGTASDVAPQPDAALALALRNTPLAIHAALPRTSTGG